MRRVLFLTFLLCVIALSVNAQCTVQWDPITGRLVCNAISSSVSVGAGLVPTSFAGNPNSLGTTCTTAPCMGRDTLTGNIWWYSGGVAPYWQQLPGITGSGSYVVSAKAGTVTTGVAASRPSSSTDGAVYCATDTFALTRYSTTTSAWSDVLTASGYVAVLYDASTGTQVYVSGSCTPLANVAASATLTANLPVIGNGGSSVTVGTRSGNTTQYVTTTGSKTTGHMGTWDANGNIIDGGAAASGGGFMLIADAASGTTAPANTGLRPGIVGVASSSNYMPVPASTATIISCRVTTAMTSGETATFTLLKDGSTTAMTCVITGPALIGVQSGGPISYTAGQTVGWNYATTSGAGSTIPAVSTYFTQP